MFTVYTKDGCPACENAKSALASKGLSYSAVKIGADITVDEFRKSYPTVRMVPFIINDVGPIGGIQELTQLLADK